MKSTKHSKSKRLFLFKTFALSEMKNAAVELELLKMAVSLLAENEKISQQRKANANKRRFRRRKSWEEFQSNLTERQFRRYFRMSKECFELLCNKIKNNIGEKAFKSEDFLWQHLNRYADNKFYFQDAHEQSTGGIISGEIKLALTLRLLAGGSYLDLSILFEMGFTYTYEIFHGVIEKWILDNRLVNIDGSDYCSDIDRMSAVAGGFSLGSNGVINGCIGAIDGWIVKIIKPMKSDGVAT
jgi:hypothetical protein